MLEQVPVWTLFVTACVTPLLVGVILGVTILFLEYRSGYFNIRRKKEIQYDIYRAYLIEKAKGEVGERLQIIFDGVLVESVTSFVVRFVNTGNVPVTSNDWMVADRVFELSQYHERGFVAGGVIYPVIPLLCTNCGNTILINAIIAGVVDEDEDDEENRDGS